MATNGRNNVANVQGWIDRRAKAGIEAAALRSATPRRGATGIIEDIGLQLADEIDRVQDFRTVRVEVKLVPIIQ